MTDNKQPSKLLTRNQVALMLSIHPKTLDRIVRGSEIQEYHFGRQIRFKESDVLEYIESKKQPSKS